MSAQTGRLNRVGEALTLSRSPGFGLLLESQRGVLLLVKIIIYATMVPCGVFVVTVAGPRVRNLPKGPSLPKDIAMGAESLPAIDGKYGDPALILGLVFLAIMVIAFWRWGT